MEPEDLSYGVVLDAKYSSSDSPANNSDNFAVEDLLDFSNADVSDDLEYDAVVVNSSPLTVGDSSSSSSVRDVRLNDSSFSGEFSVPCDEVEELEWLSNFVEQSFSSDDVNHLHLLSPAKITPPVGSPGTGSFSSDRSSIVSESNHDDTKPNSQSEITVRAKARSKRPRSSSSPSNWSSDRVRSLPFGEQNAAMACPGKKRNVGLEERIGRNDGRRCLHCSTDKTPQWRTGPLGPKTLCNACGVRYKSGRLVPEYRPAASPTFMLTKHSNSHRKVLELRRKKQSIRPESPPRSPPFLHPGVDFDVDGTDNYFIPERLEVGFQHLL